MQTATLAPEASINATLVTTAVRHGFDAHIRGGVVNIWIPWFNRDTGEEGHDRHEVRTMPELLRVLGY